MGFYQQIFLRGFDLDHGTDINISVDGMPVNMVSHAHGQGYADLHFVIPELIDKVNFNKGPYFADKGNFNTAGFVEFKTKDYLENNFVKVEGGQFSTFRAITGINLIKPQKDRRNQSLYFAGEGSFTKGYFDSHKILAASMAPLNIMVVLVLPVHYPLRSQGLVANGMLRDKYLKELWKAV